MCSTFQQPSSCFLFTKIGREGFVELATHNLQQTKQIGAKKRDNRVIEDRQGCLNGEERQDKEQLVSLVWKMNIRIVVKYSVSYSVAM